ncbi:GNAT family N-acetyltransferase [Hymenobacter sp. BT770]|uniref:GNAT family N-acetyltransferase n=1 Tax=Hymenobacter sp. BT770 TaxID=2886942 RepID=UPI001D1185D1|nr:GNAT family N-acetyltransferase [Hymenobacter sp. BT770]MCC3152697.1 GNAT family N-acetyltransferase [Hymenobacter sp. BT770]MDO3414770.1 GNAT family N-acetyltransferase [Hymenobacter sp. BT770]
MAFSLTSLGAAEARAALPHLVGLLLDAVASGAAVGFLPPLAADEAHKYWQGVIEALEGGHRVLLVAYPAGEAILLGAVQLDLATRPNALHRAEVSKLLVHRLARRQGLARQLLQALEVEARRLGRTTLVLDTRHGDVAERLYLGMGYQLVGLIPAYFINNDGQPHATTLYYKLLGAVET